MAEKLGLTMSGDTARAADQFNDTLGQTKDAITGVGVQIMSALLPQLQKYAEIIRDGIIAVKEFSKEHQTLTGWTFDAGLALTGAGGLLVGLSQLPAAYNNVR